MQVHWWYSKALIGLKCTGYFTSWYSCIWCLVKYCRILTIRANYLSMSIESENGPKWVHSIFLVTSSKGIHFRPDKKREIVSAHVSRSSSRINVRQWVNGIDIWRRNSIVIVRTVAPSKTLGRRGKRMWRPIIVTLAAEARESRPPRRKLEQNVENDDGPLAKLCEDQQVGWLFTCLLLNVCKCSSAADVTRGL